MAGNNNNWYIADNILHIGAEAPNGVTATASGTYVGNNYANTGVSWRSYASNITQVVIEDDCLGSPNLTSTAYWFNSFSNLTSGNWDNLDVSSVINMKGMFLRCSNASFNPVLNWDTSSVTNMNAMFKDCSGAAFNPTLNWDTSNVVDMYSMFQNCNGAAFNPTLNWDTSNVADMAGMFERCSNVTHIYTNNWDLSSVSSSINMFDGCPLLVGGNGTAYNATKVDATYAKIDTKFEKGYFTAATAVDLAKAEENSGFSIQSYNPTKDNLITIYPVPNAAQDKLGKVFLSDSLNATNLDAENMTAATPAALATAIATLREEIENSRQIVVSADPPSTSSSAVFWIQE